MTFKSGWLERQLSTASNTVGSWPEEKRQAFTLNRARPNTQGQVATQNTAAGKKKD